MEHQLITYSAEETMNLGQKFVALAKPGSTFCLTGDLGAGKTTLVRGIARALNIKSVVQSSINPYRCLSSSRREY